MVNDIGSLLVKIDKKSFDVHESFRFEAEHPFRSDEGHRTLDDFSEALGPYNKLEEILSSDSKLSSIESDIVCAFYSALAFRIVDSSLDYDKDKFEKAEQILERAEKIGGDEGKNLDKARSRIEWKKASYSPDIVMELRGYGKSICYGLGSIFLGEASDLITSARAPETFVKMVYEVARGMAFMFSLIIGVHGVYSGKYGLALAGFGAAAAIPLSRYLYRKKKTEQLLGYGYSIPKIKPVKVRAVV